MNARRALVALLLLQLCWLAACATPIFAPRDTGELVFWRVMRADGTRGSVSLLGSLHVGRDTFRFDPAIETALADSDALVLEVAPNELEPAAMSALVQKTGRLPEGRTLRDALDAETLEALEAYVAARSLSLAPWLHWKPWVVAMAVASDALADEGFSREHGAERSLTVGAASAQKPVRGLETAEEQIARLDALPDATQALLLRDALETGADRSSGAVLIDAWQRGDLAAIEREIFSRRRDPSAAAFFEAIYFARNRSLAAGVAQLVEQGGRSFVAIGAAHMVGEPGIPQLLRERGYRVERVRKTRAPRAANER